MGFSKEKSLGDSAGSSAIVFEAATSVSQDDVTGDDTPYTVIFDNEITDTADAYDHTTGIFTLPVTGVYIFTCTLMLADVAAANGACNSYFADTGEFTRFFLGNLGILRDAAGRVGLNGSVTRSLNVGDTMQISLQVSGGAKVVDIDGAFTSSFAGFLIK